MKTEAELARCLPPVFGRKSSSAPDENMRSDPLERGSEPLEVPLPVEGVPAVPARLESQCLVSW